MNSITAINTPSVLTMSSREIAGLVEKRHDNVKRTVDTLVAKGIIVRPQIEDEQFFDTLGRSRKEAVYLINKRDSYVVVAQLSPEFTARLVDRWQELEEQAKGTNIALPDFSNPAIAARAWADEYEQRDFLNSAMCLQFWRDIDPHLYASDLRDGFLIERRVVTQIWVACCGRPVDHSTIMLRPPSSPSRTMQSSPTAEMWRATSVSFILMFSAPFVR